MMKVIGIDPGLAGTGIGVIEGSSRKILGYSFGSISTQAKTPTPERLHSIYVKVKDFLGEQCPDLVVIEDIYSLEKYPGSGIMLGKVSGVLLLAAFQIGVQVREVSVREVKKWYQEMAKQTNFRLSDPFVTCLTMGRPFVLFIFLLTIKNKS